MQLFQSPTGYRYNSDTLLLYDFIARCNPKGSLLDVGCGCGILALLLKRDFEALKVHGIDIQEQNYTLTKANAEANELHLENITCHDFLSMRFEHKFDWIVSNPPFYHPNVVKSSNEALVYSRHGSALPFEALAQKVTKTLTNRGYFSFCYDAKQLDTLMNALSQAKLNVEALCFVHPKPKQDASLVLIRARKNSKALCQVYPPIFIYEGESFSPDVQAIFAKSQTKSIEWPN